MAEVLQARDETTGLAGLGSAVEVIGAEIAVKLTADQHVVDDGQDRGGERADGLFGATAGAQTVELRLGVAGFLAGRGPGALDQRGLEPRRALAHAGGPPLAGALVVPGAQAGPGDQVPRGREAAHVASDLGEDDAGAQVADPGNGLKSWI